MDAGQNRATTTTTTTPENLKTQLAVAVRSIQWSYAIFWSVSATQPGVLEWGDGYYNGDIKTRKTIQAVEIKADQLGLQRSEQLRELYESLSAGESSVGSQAQLLPRRASVAALSPEDLTDTEWYYLVCMSFVFTVGEGMPGRTMATAEPIWLCNAHKADSKVFSRSLLAKSALVQTVVCFPFLGGVVEIGTTEHVTEDLNLIQCMKTSFLEAPSYATISNAPDYRGVLNHEQLLGDDEYVPAFATLGLPVASPSRTTNGFDHEEEPDDDSFMVEGINGGGASQVQSWQLVDDELSNCVHQSLNSSDCISQTFVEPGKVAYGPRKGKVQETRRRLGQIQEQSQTKMVPFDLRNNDLHYQGVLSTIFKTTQHLILGPQFQNCNKRSSFTRWKRGMFQKLPETVGGDSQKVLKKALFEVPRMHQNELMDSPEDSGIRVEDGDAIADRVLSERQRREKLNERFTILRSIIPSTSKIDKVSILDETIEYLQELERRVEELESCKESTDLETRLKKRKNLNDAGERTSANCGNTDFGVGKRVHVNKRRASYVEEVEPKIGYGVPEDSLTDNLRIGSVGNEVVIELRCAWRERVLLEIMDVVSDLNLDSHSVHSSTNDGFLCLTIKCKHKGFKVATPGMIKDALQRVAWIC